MNDNKAAQQMRNEKPEFAAGSNLEIRSALAECSLGHVLVACTSRGVCAVFLGDDPEALADALRDRYPHSCLLPGCAETVRMASLIVDFIEGANSMPDLSLDLRGTDFQLKVWRALREIPSGSRASYAEIARRIGSPKSVRAVAQACAANPVAIAIPCHRVVRSDGGLSGYRWGVERKAELLRRESEKKQENLEPENR